MINFKVIKSAFPKVFAGYNYWIITASIGTLVLFLYYYILQQTTTWELFWQSNTAFYNWGQIVLSVISAFLIGISVSMFIYLLEIARTQKSGRGSILEILGSLLFSAAATGCTVCGAVLLPTIGVAASLTALPFGGLEVKLLSILVLLYAINEYAKRVLGLCAISKEKWLVFRNRGLYLNLNKQTIPQVKPLLIFLVFALIVYALPKLPKTWRVNFQKNPQVKAAVNSSVNSSSIMAQINPKEGYAIKVDYGNLGPAMIKSGVIDLNKFKDVYQGAGQPLTKQQLAILTQGSEQEIRITPENSYFLLNFFWAVGLANKNAILTEGDMVKYGEGQVENFASTGGWSLTAGTNVMDYYANSTLIPLTSNQQQLVEEVSRNIYRPCCSNSTAFPDCNHGMALLGVLELLASSGATKAEMYEAAKYFNAFWFPSNYYDLAVFFKAKNNQDFSQINARQLLSKEYSSALGWQNVKNWLRQNGYEKETPSSGGGCGV